MEIEVQLDARPGEAAERARVLLASGVDGLFTFEGQHDVFLPLAETALAHPDGVPADLTTNVAIALPRSPMHLAHTAHDLQTLSKGRFRLGLGSQIKPHIENRYGSTWDRPAARMREWVAAVRAILASWQDGTRLDFRGEFTRHTLMAPTFNPGPNAYGVPPVLMGALGPVMTRTAAEVADGLLVMPFNSGDHFRERTLPAIEAGLDRAGRDRSDLQVVPQVICAVGRTPEEIEQASVGCRFLLGFYGSTPAYRPVLEVAGREDVQPELNRLSKQGDFAAMAELVDDDLFDTIAVRGTPEQVAAEIHRRFGEHADRVCVYFPGSDVSGDLLTALVDAMHAVG
ncbi:TIGR03617 family F420-dependent LLM class oxidoreductase [Nocardioides massiliensis]|uniref:F420-dependent oxidoreductase n=1 Tax=Nocardioides massiliensis TaxID=1325935 RepID=A0ABT9NPE8_9ACTN|nr:TIGR03617 family F420-dependent LLM class oxidoreductase [Nocardioides massiliensis]MDP9822280.1 putative F420-dependent oxidoreductase [Nocardioides massiliensis]